MIKYYADSEEKYLKGILVYPVEDETDNQLYMFYDPEGEKPVYAKDALNLFNKGLMVLYAPGGGVYERPLTATIDDEHQVYGFAFPDYSVLSRFPSSNEPEDENQDFDEL